MPPTSASAARKARFWASQFHLFQAVGSIGSVFVGVLEALALLLWVPNRALLPLALVGLPIGWALGTLEVVIFPALVQRLRLPRAILLQVVGHAVLMLVLTAAFAFLARRQHLPYLWLAPGGPAATSGAMTQLRVLIIYSLAVFITSLMRQLLQRMDRRRLLQLLLGGYQEPVTENLIFLFVDLKDSTKLAESLGNARYSELVRDFFRDVGGPITAARGEVYQYVGDEVVVTWPAARGLAYANCLHCFFEMQHRIEDRHDYYTRTYGVVPQFKAGAHGGPVTTVLVGTAHRELVHHGDVLNTTARIQAQCNALNSKFLISDALYQQVKAQPEFQFTSLGSHALRGKAGATVLVDVQELAALSPSQ